MLSANLPGGTSVSNANGYVGYNGAWNDLTLATTSYTCFDGVNKPIIVTSAYTYASGSTSSGAAASGIQIRLVLGSAYTAWFSAANNSSAQSTGTLNFVSPLIAANGGYATTFKISNKTYNDFIHYGRGGSGTIYTTNGSGTVIPLQTSDGLVGRYYYAGVPSVPQALTLAKGANATEIVVSWTAPVSDGGDPITGYIVEYGTSTSYGTTVNTTNLTTTITGFTPGTKYYFRVRAKNIVYDRSSNNNYTSRAVEGFFTPTNDTVTVPNVIGLTEAAAIAAINAVYPVGSPTVTLQSSSSSLFLGSNSTNTGTVASQNPVSGTVVAAGSTVSISVYNYSSFGMRYDEDDSGLTIKVPIKQYAKRWNGSSWVDITTRKRWNGTAWVDITSGNV